MQRKEEGRGKRREQMHQSRICVTIVNDISKHVDDCDNHIYVTEAEGLGINPC